jgi:hypothetical protein
MNLPSRLGKVQQEKDAMQMLFSYDTKHVNFITNAKYKLH